MTKGANHNHPKKGDCITVEPIKSIEDINKIKALLKGHPRNYAIFIVGINTNLRASDLVSLTVGQVRDLKPMDTITLRERKTQKVRTVIINSPCIASVAPLLTLGRPDTEPLFVGLRGPLKPNTINALVKGWCKAVGLKGNFGAHTLRKTWGYHQRVTFGVDLPTLTQCFNHNSQRVTLRYLCIQPEEIAAAFKNEL